MKVDADPYFTPIRSILNRDNLGRPMGGRLKQNIRDNIAMGLKRFPGQQFLYGYDGNPFYRRLDELVGTIPTVGTWAFITPATRVEDTLHRMLTHTEIKLAMGFPEHYQILGSCRKKIWQLGNAVCPPIMADILKRWVVAIASVEEQGVA